MHPLLEEVLGVEDRHNRRWLFLSRLFIFLILLLSGRRFVLVGDGGLNRFAVIIKELLFGVL